MQLFPPALTDKEQFSADLDTALRAADNSDPTSDQIRLPAYAGDTPLSWSRPKGPFLTILFILTLLLPTLFWFQKDEKMKELAKKRRELLDLDYSELLFKLTLLIGAGLTIKGAFSRICRINFRAERDPVLNLPIRYMGRSRFCCARSQMACRRKLPMKTLAGAADFRLTSSLAPCLPRISAKAPAV